MKNRLACRVAAVFASMIGNQDEVKKENPYIELIENARKEFQQAEKYFETVSDPDLVDYAIFQLEAARKKYIYLLKSAQNQGINLTSNNIDKNEGLSV